MGAIFTTYLQLINNLLTTYLHSRLLTALVYEFNTVEPRVWTFDAHAQCGPEIYHPFTQDGQQLHRLRPLTCPHEHFIIIVGHSRSNRIINGRCCNFIKSPIYEE